MKGSPEQDIRSLGAMGPGAGKNASRVAPPPLARLQLGPWIIKRSSCTSTWWSDPPSPPNPKHNKHIITTALQAQGGTNVFTAINLFNIGAFPGGDHSSPQMSTNFEKVDCPFLLPQLLLSDWGSSGPKATRYYVYTYIYILTLYVCGGAVRGVWWGGRSPARSRGGARDRISCSGEPFIRCIHRSYVSCVCKHSLFDVQPSC